MCLLGIVVWTQNAQPYRRIEDNTLSEAAYLLLLLIYSGGFLIKLFEDISETSPELARRVMGFDSSDGIVVWIAICSGLSKRLGLRTVVRAEQSRSHVDHWPHRLL